MQQHVVVRNLAEDITQSNIYLDVQYDRRSLTSHLFRKSVHGKKKCIVVLAVGKETTRVHEEGGGEEGDMNYLRGPHSPCYGMLREVGTSQTKKTDGPGYQRILA
jgi:hypothetical protein